jgi:hypothetical protein
MRTCGVPPQAKPETSRFPNKELPHMPGSPTTPGRADTRVDVSVHVAFRENEHVGTRIAQVFAAQWLAYVLPCRRFAATLTGDCARLGAGAGRYSFTVVDLHLLLLGGFTGAPKFKIFTLRAPVASYSANSGPWAYGGVGWIRRESGMLFI